MSKTPEISKLEISADTISIQWTDGHQSKYGGKYLRVNCGCAECVEEWSQRKILDPLSVASDIRVEDYLITGRYAVQFLWSDTHYTGIYPFDLLRRLCQCEECSSTEE